jgi:hypothetical protein
MTKISELVPARRELKAIFPLRTDGPDARAGVGRDPSSSATSAKTMVAASPRRTRERGESDGADEMAWRSK